MIELWRLVYGRRPAVRGDASKVSNQDGVEHNEDRGKAKMRFFYVETLDWAAEYWRGRPSKTARFSRFARLF